MSPHRQNHSAPHHQKPRNLSAHPYPKAESLTLLPHHTPSRRPRDRAGASIGSDPQKPCAQRKSRSSPCERRTDPAEPPTASHPIARTTAQTPTENPETSQRTHIQRLKASPSSHTTPPAGSRGIGPERALEAIHKKKPARSAKADPPPSLPASAGPIPQNASECRPHPHHFFTSTRKSLLSRISFTEARSCPRPVYRRTPMGHHIRNGLPQTPNRGLPGDQFHALRDSACSNLHRRSRHRRRHCLRLGVHELLRPDQQKAGSHHPRKHPPRDAHST
jgi:hypothetical protein